MQVQNLIEVLKKMPPDASVMHLWDGEARTNIEFVWLARSGVVVTADFNEKCYSGKSRPVDAPTEEESRYWQTPNGKKK